jgi:hypothetical protein
MADMIREEWKPGTYVPPPLPPTDEGRGKPREQYKRVYNVIPNSATTEEAVAIFKEGWERSHETSGGSYDDSAVGDLDYRHARVFGIPMTERQTFLDWYAVYYPGVAVEFASMPELGNHDYPNPDEANSDYLIIDVVDQLPKHPREFYRTRALSKITTLTIHHTVSPPDRSIASIASYHVNNRGWPGIGYHYVINDLGEIRQTNHLDTKSYHAGTLNAPGDENLWSVGIALQGDFTDSPPPQAQLNAARWLVAELKSDLDITAVLPHRGMPGAQTQCPGNTWEDWLPYVSGN